MSESPGTYSRYFAELSFKGTHYHGWQLQENAHSVQAEVNKAFSSFFKTPIETAGCGRTDTGVHARRYFVHFDLNWKIVNLPDAAFHINCILPDDISVHKITAVNSDAHARFNALERTYEYTICRIKDPFLKEYSYHYRDQLDINKMNKAAVILKEYKDFSAFSKSNTQVKTNDCDIHAADWKENGNILVFKISANRFLRNMVRALVGTLMEIGKGKITIDEFKKIIEGKNRSEAGLSVPACGLSLVDIVYPHDLFINEIIQGS